MSTAEVLEGSGCDVGVSINRKGDGGRPPTMRDIADHVGVSQPTVSRALRNDPRLDKGTIEKVKAAALELGYNPMRHQEARRLISRRYGTPMLNHTIGLFFDHKGFSKSNYFIQVLQGIFDALTDEKFEVHTSDTPDSGGSAAVPAVYMRGDVDGVLTLAQEHNWKTAMAELRKEPGFADKPIVGLVERLDGCSAVHADDIEAGRLAMSHLLALGHRKVLVFYPLDIDHRSAHSLRVEGFFKACQEFGLDPKHTIVAGTWSSRELTASVERLRSTLEADPSITAIIHRHDRDAVAAYKALSGFGVRVPEDVSLVGFDDSDAITGGFGENILTTVRLPLQDIGYQGAKLLVRRILGQETEDQDIVLPVEMVVRRSTAAPKS